MELRAALFEELLEHGLSGYPNEACALVVGKDGVPSKVLPMRNADASPVSYRLEPKEQLRAFQEIDDEGLELLGIFHTHTHSEAFPSETDRAQAFYPEAAYLIMSLANREAPVIRAFRIVDGEVSEEEVRVA
jgi:proteasome lid subunit RPN8/RPN11